MLVDVELDRLVTLLFVVLRPVDSEFTPVDSELMPVEVDVDSDAMLLLAVFRPVDNDRSPVDVVVDSEVTFLLVADSPVDNELIPLCASSIAAKAEVDSEAT